MTLVIPVNRGRLCVLVLPGGKPESRASSRAWQLANLRMALLAGSLRKLSDDDVVVRRVQYRRRGWNSPRLDALRDAESALDDARDRYVRSRFVLVGHSMGGRVAAHLSRHPDVHAVAALAPWWPDDDAGLVPTGCRLLVVHGTDDRWTDPGSSRAQVRRARERGVDARWVGLDGAGHYMMRQVREWHRLTADFVHAQLAEQH